MILLQSAKAAEMSEAAQLGVILLVCLVAAALIIGPILWRDAKRQAAEDERRRKANERYQNGGSYSL